MRSLRFLIAAALAGCGTSSSSDDAAPAADLASAPGDAAAPLDAAAGALVVVTDKGAIAGQQLASGVRAFLGVPYAAPPLGPLRFRPPVPAAAWAQTRDATRPRPECPQLDVLGVALAANIDEDCLTLDVWAPPAAASPRPVMVWIYGGGFTSGSISDSTYDGAKLAAAGGAVVVSMNYRLGPLGFLAHPALATEDPAHAASGNQGLEDQRAALAWVKANAAAFGGDPSKITLFGESAGAISVCMHQVSPPSQGLFQRALQESSACGVPVPTRAAAEAQGAAFAKALGCDGLAAAPALACLRGKSMADVINALPLKSGFFFGNGASWGPIVDGIDVPEQPGALWPAGKFAKAPTLLGTNGDEGTIFLALAQLAGSSVKTDADYQAGVAGIYGTLAPKIVAQYPSAQFASPSAALAEVLGDGIFVCTTRRVARALAAAGVPAFQYSFRHAVSFPLLNYPLGAFHGSETGLVFGNGFEGTPLTADEVKLSAAMQGYWSHFAAAGDPNQGGAPSWPAFTVAGDGYQTLDLTISSGSGLKKARCDFWDSLK